MLLTHDKWVKPVNQVPNLVKSRKNVFFARYIDKTSMLWVELFFVPKWIFLIKKFRIGMNRQKNDKKYISFLVSLNEAPTYSAVDKVDQMLKEWEIFYIS